MKKMFVFLATVLCSFSVVAQRISIQPSILDFRLGPSGLQSESIKITNLSDHKISFQAYLADWLRDSTGGHMYFKPDTLKRSCASWIRLSKNFIEVEPNQVGEIIVQLQAPADPAQFKQMKWAMLFLQSTEEQDATKNNKQLQTQIKELLRVGIHIYQTPPALNKYAVKAVSFVPVKNESNSYELTAKNTGDMMLQCKAYITLTDVASGQEYKLDKTEFPVFPEGVRKVKFTIPGSVPKGKYSALAIVDIGEEMPLEAIEQPIEIK